MNEFCISVFFTILNFSRHIPNVIPFLTLTF